MSPSVYMTGLSMGLGLIVAIGAQNAFVLRQGLKREHVLPVVLACALSDALLIALGVTSLAQVIALMPWLEPAMRYGGSRTDQRHRGKGLPQIVEVVSRSGRGKLSVFSRGGWCIRNSDGRLRSGAVSSSIGGTLVEWVLELSPASVVADQ